MEQVLEQRIRQRAYEIWETVGRLDGDSHQHWLAAERELVATSMQFVLLLRKRRVRAKPIANRSSPALGPGK